jgi:hypothetical protein
MYQVETFFSAITSYKKTLNRFNECGFHSNGRLNENGFSILQSNQKNVPNIGGKKNTLRRGGVIVSCLRHKKVTKPVILFAQNAPTTGRMK